MKQNIKPRETWIHVAFSAEGIKKFGLKLPPSTGAYGYDLDPIKNEMVISLKNGAADAADDPFKVGMHKRNTKLGDTGEDAPEKWIKPFKPGLPPNDFPPIDGLLRVDSDEPEDADNTTVDLLVESTERGIICEGLQKGTGLFNLHGKQIEHFGFRDGVSQPLIRGIDDDEIEEREVNPDGHDYKKFVLFGLSGNREWANDGSFMVFRRLSQDFAGFWQFMNEKSQELGLTPSGLAARFVGRWRSGAPLSKFQAGDPELPSEFDFNDFKYMKDASGQDVDPKGENTPRFSHIRKVYPRDDGISPNASENSLKNQERRIMRRGIPFGPRFADSPDAERGLLFMCFQIDLEHQFEFIQQTWANNKQFPLTDPGAPAGHGHDAIIGKHHDQGFVNLFKNGQFKRIPDTGGFKQWVTTTGGVYLFSPSISALKKMKP